MSKFQNACRSPSVLLDSTRLLFDLQQVSQVIQSFAGCLEPEAIAQRATDGLVEKFDCAFARIWVVEPDRLSLRLIASSGMYRRLDGSFARVPMGAFKIGKIAQNCIPFLSNRLSEESWVKDRQWAIDNQICGFAGYPLVISGQVVGVLAVFSQQPMPAEFLEMLQLFCNSVAVALHNALLYQAQYTQQHQLSTPLNQGPLSDQLANILQDTRLTLVGTERSLTAATTATLLRAAELLRTLRCIYCRLTYTAEQTALEAVIPQSSMGIDAVLKPKLDDLSFALASLGGALHLQSGANPTVTELTLTVPNLHLERGPTLQICCQSPILQAAFTQLAYQAGLTVGGDSQADVPILTHQPEYLHYKRVMWLALYPGSVPAGVSAKIDLFTSPQQLRQAVEAVLEGKTWNLPIGLSEESQPLSSREQEVMALLAQGLRDRDIANQLYISERTVKFHINNLVNKLNAGTRVQALHHAILQGWIHFPLSE